MSAEWIPADPNNFSTGRSGNTVSKIVLHTTVGSMAGTIATFQNPTRQASAHYVVGLDGRLVQMVRESDTAWHAGDFPINEQSIGIEHVDDGDYNGPRTPELYGASAILVADICRRYAIACNRTFIRKHSEVSDLPTSCPDALDVERIVNAAAAILVAPTGPTPIMGPAVATLTAMLNVLAGHMPAYGADVQAAIAQAYLEVGTSEGVAGDAAWAQAMHETGYLTFGGDVKADQYNFCGLGATGGGVPGYSFPTIVDGVRAHLRHLRAYATTDALSADTPTVDPRGVPASLRGSAVTFQALGGRWAPSLAYGDAIEAVIAKVRQTAFGAGGGTITGGDDLANVPQDQWDALQWRVALMTGAAALKDVPLALQPAMSGVVSMRALFDSYTVDPSSGFPTNYDGRIDKKLNDILAGLNSEAATLQAITTLEQNLATAVGAYGKLTSSGLTQTESQELADTLTAAQGIAAQLKKDLAP